MSVYFQPLVQCTAPRPADALPLAGTPAWFDRAIALRRGAAPILVPARDIPDAARARLSDPRPEIAGQAGDAPTVMGILNVTPDSFSDGGRLAGPDATVAEARAMLRDGAGLLDVGGESTRPGAQEVPEATEIARIEPAIAALTAAGLGPVSIDTRKADVARAAIAAGAVMVNDVSGLRFDPDMAGFCAENALPVCVMHAQGTPETMQDDPRYADVLLDVYDWLAERIAALEAAGIPRARIIVDPGIGFGKTMAHNLALLRGVALFHGLGCRIMVGASRKGFIGRITDVAAASDRVAGSVSSALYAAAQGVQMLRVHDVAETCQALRVWRAIDYGEPDGT